MGISYIRKRMGTVLILLEEKELVRRKRFAGKESEPSPFFSPFFFTIIFLLLIAFSLTPLCANTSITQWQNYEKRIIGDSSPIDNIYPYTVMTNQGSGIWQYSCYYIPGQKVNIKFMVNTNMISPKYIYELRDPREIEITFGTQGKIYVTNTPAGLMRVTEGTGTGQFMSIEFNWEDEPDAPTGLSALVDSGKAHIQWTESFEMDVIGYNVYISNNFYPYYKKVNSEFITNTQFTITNLISGSTNYVYVTGVDAYTNMPNFESPSSSVVQFIADKMVQVLFYLKKKRSEVSDSIYLGGNIAPLDWTPSQKISYLYNDIWYLSVLFMKGASLEYKYNMNQDDSNWECQFSTSSGNREITITDSDNDGVMVINDVYGIYTILNPAPQSPTNIIAVPGNIQVYLKWDANKEIDFKEYKIYRAVRNTNKFYLVKQLEQTNYLDISLSNNTNYYYKISALDYENNESPFAEIVQATPSTNPHPIIPRGLKALPGDTRVLLSWHNNPETDIQGYIIWRCDDKYSLYSNIALVSVTYYTDISVINGEDYFYKIQAVDTINQTNDGYSSIVSVIPSTNPSPVMPTGLEVVVTKNQKIIVKWIANDENDIAGYNVYYKQENGVVHDPLFSTTPLYTVITGLVNGAKYSVWVKAVDTIGQEGEASDIVTAYPVPEITDLITKPSGTETGAVLLGWTSPDKAGDLGDSKRYIVKYSTSQISTFHQFWDASLFCDTLANVSGTIESLKVNNFGTGCPGYYFTVGAIYGDDQGVGLSQSVFENASQLVNPASGGVFRKKGSRIKINIPAYTIPEEVSAIVIRNYNDIIKSSNVNLNSILNTANEKVESHAVLKLINNGENNIYDITLLNSAGDTESSEKFSDELTVYLPFNDSNHNLIVDETETQEEYVIVGTLKMFWLNEDINEWAIIDDSTIDYVNNYLISKIDHLTLFAPIANPPYSDLKSMAVYPNPAYFPGDNNKIVFTKLTAKVRIRIYNLAGELVKTHEKNDLTDKWLWNGLNESNEPAASGLYIYYIEDGRSEPARGKLAIIR